MAVMAVVLLGLASPALAQQLPALTALSANVAASNPELASRRAALMQERVTLHGKIDSLNARCGAVEEGSVAEASCKSDQAVLVAALNSHIQQCNDFNAVVQAATVSYAGPASLNDPSIVDARNVPTGLPTWLAAEIPATPAGERVRKGFEAIVDHDWNVAHAWFQDALNHDPGNAGIQRLIDLAAYTMKRSKNPAPPSKPVADTRAQDKATITLLDRQLDDQMNADLARALDDFDRNYLPKHPASTEATKPVNNAHGVSPPASRPQNPVKWKAFFDALFSRPPQTPRSVSAVRD